MNFCYKKCLVSSVGYTCVLSAPFCCLRKVVNNSCSVSYFSRMLKKLLCLPESKSPRSLTYGKFSIRETFITTPLFITFESALDLSYFFLSSFLPPPNNLRKYQTGQGWVFVFLLVSNLFQYMFYTLMPL